MAPSKIRKAIGAVKDHTSIGLAKVGGGKNGLSDLEVAIVKATRHKEYPPDDRYFREIINLTTYSQSLVSACFCAIAKRLNRTKNWVVALKTLMLVQRLLSEGDRAYDEEIFFSTRHGTHFLNMSDFRDASQTADAWDYSVFVRTYALYLEEQLEYRMQGCRRRHGGYAYNEEEEEGVGGGRTSNATVVGATPLYEMKNEVVFSRIDHLVQLLVRFLACRPTGPAKHNRVVAAALDPIVKESFQICYDMTGIIGVLIDRFMQLEVPDMVRVHEIFHRISKQYDELDSFYAWCKTVRIVVDYPHVDKVSQQKLDLMDDFIHQKIAMQQSKGAGRSPDPKAKCKPVEAEPGEDTKALLPPAAEGSAQETDNKEEVKEPKEEEKRKTQQEVGDLLNLSSDDDAPSTRGQENKLALSLFDDGPTQPTTAPHSTTTTKWEAFKGPSGDWEAVLVRSLSHVSNQKPSLAGGIDKVTLNAMYQQGPMAQGLAGRPAMLALPAPPAANGGANNFSPSNDPFAASNAIPPPPYVQARDMERRQRLLVEEQFFWQYCGRNRMPGWTGFANVQQHHPYQYIRGCYTQTW